MTEEELGTNNTLIEELIQQYKGPYLKVYTPETFYRKHLENEK